MHSIVTVKLISISPIPEQYSFVSGAQDICIGVARCFLSSQISAKNRSTAECWEVLRPGPFESRVRHFARTEFKVRHRNKGLQARVHV